MRTSARLPLSALLALALASCFPRATVPDADRQRIARELDGQARYLAVSLHVGPFFGDGGKLLASDQPFAELELLETPNGRVITPPAAERVLPAGTPARISRVEIPTGWAIGKRVVMTPRYHPWVFLEVPGEALPVVIVLPQEAASFDDVRRELDRVLTAVDPAPALRGLPEEQRKAIARKQVLDGMGPRAAEMAWGLPAKRILDVPARKEEWEWPGARRRAWFENGVLVRWSMR